MPPKFFIVTPELHRDVLIVTAKLMNLNNGAR